MRKHNADDTQRPTPAAPWAPYGTTPDAPTPPTKRPRRTRGVALTLVAIGGIALGGIIGAAAGSNSHDEEAAATVTATAPAPAAETQGPSIPSSCLTALSQADKLAGHFSEWVGHTMDLMDGITNMDTSTMVTATQNLTDMSDKVIATTDDYQTARDKCRSAQ